MAAIVDTELFFRLTTTAGTAGNSQAGTPSGSLGKYASTTPWTGGAIGDLFDILTVDDNLGGGAEYRCLAFGHANAANAAQDVRIFLKDTDGGALVAIGVDPAPASPIGAAAAQGASIATKTDTPAGVVFSSPTTLGAAINLGNVPPGHVRLVWVRRTGAATPSTPADACTLSVRADSGQL